MKLVTIGALYLSSIEAAITKRPQPVEPRGLNLTVDLGYGVYKGFRNSTTDLNIWRGIRYAEPPTGENRWVAPKAPKTNRTVIEATAFGPACPQSLPAVPNAPFIPGNEDCLFLNVYAPSTTSTTKKLPVLVWIHGGGYGLGDGTQDMTEIIAANNNGFIAVAIQYRLGAFGFLSSAAVKASGVVNAGLLDMAFALEFVEKNIGSFGGDKSKVTISGESAGGGAVMLLGIAKAGTLGTSLFRNGIASSPYLPPQYNFDGAFPTQRYQDFASQAGCDGNDTLTCLRAKDSTTLQQASASVTAAGTYATWAFLPVTDFDFITETPSRALAAKKVNGLNMLVSNNANEGPLFVPPTINTEDDLKVWLKLILPALGSAEIMQVLDSYPINASIDQNLRFATNGVSLPTALDVSQVATGQQQRANNIYAEATFVCPSYWINDAYSSPAYASYHYQYSNPFASHGEDVPALFGPAQLNQPPTFTSKLRQIWGEFVKYDISSTVQTKWARGKGARMVNLNITGGTPYQAVTQFGTVTQFQNPGIQNAFPLVDAYSWEGGRGKRCEFWRGIADKVPN
ncbi:Alpha/Beta hydrolase protein [Pyrenochaeta sp. MPI-SDFR-AT-0127]|nr:Alpha/Beta hydrolase protein [Pyrenochaeta sp. MPI-SDFR-AT-0127]